MLEEHNKPHSSQKTFKRTNLRTTIGLATISFLIASALMVSVVYQLRLSTEKEALKKTALYTQNHFQHKLSILAAKAKTLAQDNVLVLGASSGALIAKSESRLSELKREHPELEALLFFDKSYNLRTSLPTEYGYYKSSDLTELLKQLNIATNINTQSYLINKKYLIYSPVKFFDGTLRGFIVLLLPIDFLFKTLPSEITTKSYFELRHKNQIQFTHGTPLPIKSSQEEQKTLLPDNVDLIIKWDRGFLMAPIYSYLWKVILLLIVILFAAIFIGKRLIHSVTAPLDSLTRYVSEFRNFNFTSPKPHMTYSEFENVGEALELLGESISQYAKDLEEKTQKERELEQARSQAELTALSYQMRPHFLFNSLNSISTMIDLDPKEAKSVITRLASLYRNILQAGKTNTIKLEQELELIEDYLTVQQARFLDRLKFKITNNVSGSIFIPGLMGHTLVENALKHGVAQLESGGSIEITVDQVSENRYSFIVKNQCPEFNSNKEGTKTGLANSRTRLNHLYDDSYTLSFNIQDQQAIACFEFSGEQI